MAANNNAREADAEIKNLLIDLVRQRVLIYDRLHYRTNARNEAWDEIGKILGIPGECFQNIYELYNQFLNGNAQRQIVNSS